MKKCLLDELADRTAHICLSDLKSELGTKIFDFYVQTIPRGAYPLLEWIECVDYLVPGEHGITTEDEARRCLAEARYPAWEVE